MRLLVGLGTAWHLLINIISRRLHSIDCTTVYTGILHVADRGPTGRTVRTGLASTDTVYTGAYRYTWMYKSLYYTSAVQILCSCPRSEV